MEKQLNDFLNTKRLKYNCISLGLIVLTFIFFLVNLKLKVYESKMIFNLIAINVFIINSIFIYRLSFYERIIAEHKYTYDVLTKEDYEVKNNLKIQYIQDGRKLNYKIDKETYQKLRKTKELVKIS